MMTCVNIISPPLSEKDKSPYHTMFFFFPFNFFYVNINVEEQYVRMYTIVFVNMPNWGILIYVIVQYMQIMHIQWTTHRACLKVFFTFR